MPSKSSFLDKVLGRIGRLDAQGLATVVQRLARERNFLETVFNAIEDGVLVVDEGGRVIYYNQSVVYLLGLADSAAEGQHITSLLPALDWKQISGLDTAGGQRVIRYELEISHPRPRFLRVYAASLGGDRRGSSGVAFILHDATEARQKTIEAIESERIQALTLLAGSVAHEIGNPLNALHIHLQLMEREVRKLKRTVGVWEPVKAGGGRDGTAVLGAGDEAGEIASKLENYLNVAKGEISRLDYIITQFLQAIRPSQPQFKTGSLNDVVLETLELLRPELENRGQRIEEKLARPLPPGHFDPAQVKQVLVNLIKNAMQAMSRGGVLTVQTGASGDDLFIGVTDTGSGINQDQMKRIFEPFYTTKKKGSGLGLMIVQRIVRAHGGRVEVETRQGQGTTFRVWLPLHARQTRLLEARLND